MEQSEYIIVNNGGRFDLQRVATTLLNKIGLSTTGIPGELHVPSYMFNGPGSNLFYESEKRFGRLNDDFTPKEWSKPINGIDQATYYHDCDYYRAKNSGLSSDEILELKDIADERIIASLENYTPNGLMKRYIKFAVINVLQAKIKFEMGLNDQYKMFNEQIYNTVNELHHRYKEGERRMIIVPSINHTHSCNIFEYGKVKIFTYIDCFSKKACVIIVSKKSEDNTIKALDYAFNILGNPKFLWSDNGKEFINKLVQSYLKEHNVHWYRTNSELKAVIVQRFNLTLREWIDKYKTECELKEDQKFNLKEALEKFIEYYNNHEHSTVKMSPNDAHKEENE